MKNKNRENLKKNYIFYFPLFIFCLFLLSSFSLLNPDIARAATSLYLVPATGTYTVGNTFLIELRVNSGGEPINAADGTLVFDVDDFSVQSITKEGSIFVLWVQEPTFSNSLGTISFAGGKPSPGYTGSAGIIFHILVKAKTAGTANITFAAGSVLADDGKGTNVLGSMKGANYAFVAREITVPPAAPEEYGPTTPSGQTPAGQTPFAPVVSSPTHPDENKWYSNDNPEFSWKLPSDVSGVSLMLNEKSTSNPGSISDGLMESKKYENVEDGSWYLHVKFRNQYGWGTITHRKVLIDTEPPEPFEVTADNGGDPLNPSPVLTFKTTDGLSGMDYYEVKVTGEGEEAPVIVEKIDVAPYKIPVQTPGKYNVEVRAFDKAGNYALASVQIEISPIQAPVITKYPKRLNIGQALDLEGESLPDLTNIIFIQEKNQKTATSVGETSANENGKWTFSSTKTLEKGEYFIWAVSRNEKGARSLPSERVQVSVGLPPFLQFGKIVIDYLTIMVTFIVLIGAAIVVIFYGWYRIVMWRKRVRLETKELAQAISAAFKALREEVEEQIEYLDEKPGLTKSEREVRDKLKQALEIAEGFVSKELKDVERELE